MKKLTSFFLVCLFAGQAFSQIQPENPDPFLFRPFTHSGNLKSTKSSLQAKSFYQSKSDWQTIIDTTWGPGRPLNQKLAVFDTYTGDLTVRFAGFTSLGIDPAEWDSIKASYRSRIDSSTSKGAFAALMSRLAYDLHDCHVHAWDTSVLCTPLNPGIPVLCIGTIVTNHFGAVLTVLPDSSLLVLRTIENHPLGLQPGDIVLGYEGVPWKDLVDELLGSGIPLLSWSRGAKSALRYYELASAGMNWHLFETIDIVKYESGDTVHLPVYPMINLPVPPKETEWYNGKGVMWYNEQLPVPGIPFPDPEEFNKRSVTYGIVEGTNIGYIYLYVEILGPQWGFAYNTDDQFYEAVKSLSETEGLIIDLRVNFGGLQLLDRAFNLLFNIRQPSIEDAIRCNQTDFNLCNVSDYTPYGYPLAGSAKDPNLLFIPGNPMSWYDKPIAILTGPGCVSMGDIHAYRFGYHPMTRFFGKSTCASLSWSWGVGSYPEWILGHSFCDMYHVNDPDVFLNRREFPVDDSVWFDAESVAAGKDAVVEKAMEWIQNLSYARNILVNPHYGVPGTDTITLTAQVINPNDHNLYVNALITSADSTITDTVFLFDDGNHNDGNPGDGTWGALWPAPDMKTIFAADVTTEDLTAGTSRTITDAAKFTSNDPVVVDEITYTGSEIFQNCEQKLYFAVALRNNDLTASAVKIRAKLTSLDTTLADIITDYNIEYADIAPGEISTSSTSSCISISEDCQANEAIPVKVDISSDLYAFWSDTFSITVRAPLITAEDNTICDEQQTNIDIRNDLVSTQTVYYTYTSALDSEGAVTGNTANSKGVWEKLNIKDNLDNITDQAQRVVYTITPYILKLDNSIGCPGTPITADIWVEPTVVITAEDDTIQDGCQTNIEINSVQVSTHEVGFTYTSAPDNAEAVTGNTSNAKGLPITNNIQDTLYNMTDQAQRVVYRITPQVLKSDNSIGCIGTSITVNIQVEPWGVNTENISNLTTRIYPNPVYDIINVEISNTGEKEIVIELLTVSGQLIYRKEYKYSKEPFVKQINLSGYAKGVYFVRIRQEGAVCNGKIIIM
jgi:hypothetical protein